jgi:WD40 repeat protein
MITVNLVHGKKLYQETAVSPTCDTIALIDQHDFMVLSVLKDIDRNFSGTFPVISYGANDGQFGSSSNVVSARTPVTPRYTRAVMSDRSLCIACEEGEVDVRDPKTGRRMNIINASRNCIMVMSANGDILALAMNSGELKVLSSGPDWDFNTQPIIVIGEEEHSRFVKCMAFAPNSNFLATCTADNIIRTFKLDMKLKKATLRSRHNVGEVPGDGVTSLTLYRPL